MQQIELSLILPCYNEVEHFTQSVEHILATLKKTGLTYEIIFVEDKSTDKTSELLKGFLRKYKSLPIRIIWQPINLGRGHAVTTGIKNASGSIVGYIDIDLEVGPQYIAQCVTAIQRRYELVCAYRRYQFSLRTISRWVASTSYRKISQIAFHHNLHDTEAGYKFFKKSTILPVLKLATDPHWFWDTEIMLYSYYAGLKITEISVQFNRRMDKTSTVKLIPDTIEYIRKLIRLHKKLKKNITL